VTWEEAMAVLHGWRGRSVLVVPILGPGLSVLALEQPRRGVIRLSVPTDPPDPELTSPDGVTIALPRATFISADWIAGQEEKGLSVVQGGARVDVFLDGE
jgi:hypothetical protein